MVGSRLPRRLCNRSFPGRLIITRLDTHLVEALKLWTLPGFDMDRRAVSGDITRLDAAGP